MSARIEVQFLIPEYSNNKKAFSKARHEAFQAVLDRLFGGYTGPLAAIGGSWRDVDGTIYRDLNRTYIVWVDGLLSAAARILEAAAFAKTNYRQLAIAVRYLGHAEVL